LHQNSLRGKRLTPELTQLFGQALRRFIFLINVFTSKLEEDSGKLSGKKINSIREMAVIRNVAGIK